MKKIYAYIAISTILVSCGAQVDTNNDTTNNSTVENQEVDMQKVAGTQETAELIETNTEIQKIAVTSSIVPLSSVINTIG